MAPVHKKATLPTRIFQRTLHRSNILDLIRRAELISRKELALRTGLSQATVTGITADLIHEGLIEEKTTGASGGGRKPILLAIRADGVYAIGINMEIDQLRVVIVNFHAEMKASHIVSLTEDSYTPEQMVSIMSQAVKDCMWKANYTREQIAGIGVGIPGPVDSPAGIIRFLPNYGWKEVAFRDYLQEAIGHPVFIDNSSNNLAIAQYWHGRGRGIDNFLVVTLENGVGAGIVQNGQLIRGHRGIAGEFGHLCIDPAGPACRCGRRGCIEAYAGNSAIIRAARAIAARGTWLSSDVPAEEIVFADILYELKENNSELVALYAKAGEALAIGIFNVITLLNPERVILTGEGVQAGEVLLKPLFETISRLRRGRFGFGETEIIVQAYSDGDWARESGTLVLLEIYKSPTTR